MIYIVNGFPQSGKTTFERFVLYHLGGEGNYGHIFSMVDFIKDVATYCGWKGEKEPADRAFLSNLKDILSAWRDLPFQKTTQAIDLALYQFNRNFLSPAQTAIFVDARTPEDIERLLAKYDAWKVFIERPTDFETPPTFSNHADQNVSKKNYDILIRNDGSLQDLEEKAKKFITLNAEITKPYIL